MSDVIKHLSDEELLAGIRDDQPREVNQVDLWLRTAGYESCSSFRCPSRELYEEYVEWKHQHPEMTGVPLPIRDWGWQMARRFQRGRGYEGNFYYVRGYKHNKSV